MGVQVTVRNVPDEVRDALALRAANAHQSMQEYLLGQLERLASLPTIGTWLEAVRERKSVTRRVLSAEEILGHRDADRR